jgi:hypothetical protein
MSALRVAWKWELYRSRAVKRSRLVRRDRARSSGQAPAVVGRQPSGNLGDAMRSMLFWLQAALILSATIFCGGGDDDDDRQTDDGGNDDDYGAPTDDDGDDDDNDDDNDDDFQCGDDLLCHDAYLECVVDCDTWDCIEGTCLTQYRACLSPDGCTLIYLNCRDDCGSDENCLAVCEQDRIDCFAAECNANAVCLETCNDAWLACKDDCGLDVGCLIGCYLDYEGCFWDCLP